MAGIFLKNDMGINSGISSASLVEVNFSNIVIITVKFMEIAIQETSPSGVSVAHL